jgi:hypothetical protein
MFNVTYVSESDIGLVSRETSGALPERLTARTNVGLVHGLPAKNAQWVSKQHNIGVRFNR